MTAIVIPAQAGTQTHIKNVSQNPCLLSRWVPACAGMTAAGAQS